MTSRLTFSPPHRWSLDGAWVPSVTTLTGVMDKPGLVGAAAKETAAWAANNAEQLPALGWDMWTKAAAGAYREKWSSKAGRGTDLHAHAHQLATTGSTEDVPDEQLLLVQQAADFLDRWNVRTVAAERGVYHAELAYAGRFDLIADAGQTRWLFDFKTGSGVWPEHVLQQSGYRYTTHMHNEDGSEDLPMLEVDRVGIVWIRPDGWDVFPVRATAETFRAFVSLIPVYRFTRLKDTDVIAAPIPKPAKVAP